MQLLAESEYLLFWGFWPRAERDSNSADRIWSIYLCLNASSLAWLKRSSNCKFTNIFLSFCPEVLVLFNGKTNYFTVIHPSALATFNSACGVVRHFEVLSHCMVDIEGDLIHYYSAVRLQGPWFCAKKIDLTSGLTLHPGYNPRRGDFDWYLPKTDLASEKTLHPWTLQPDCTITFSFEWPASVQRRLCRG